MGRCWSLLQMLLAWGLTTLLVATVLMPTCALYGWNRADSRVRNLRNQVENACEWASEGDPPITADMVDQWLAGKAPPTHSVGWFDRAPELDPWQRPYRCVHRGTDGWGIYSLGSDGVSLTAGNDPDDLNSWDHHAIASYNLARDVRVLLFVSALALPFTPLMLALLQGVTGLLGRALAGPSREDPTSAAIG